MATPKENTTSKASEENRDPRKHYIIDTKTSDAPLGRMFTYEDFEANKEYKELKEMAKNRTLEDKFPKMDSRLAKRAENFHSVEHLTPEVHKYETDDEGMLWIPQDDPEAAKRAYRSLSTIDPKVKVVSFGLPIPGVTNSEDDEPMEKQSLKDRLLGKRPKKARR